MNWVSDHAHVVSCIKEPLPGIPRNLVVTISRKVTPSVSEHSSTNLVNRWQQWTGRPSATYHQ